jgi:hypothetical protein
MFALSLVIAIEIAQTFSDIGAILTVRQRKNMVQRSVPEGACQWHCTAGMGSGAGESSRARLA